MRFQTLEVIFTKGHMITKIFFMKITAMLAVGAILFKIMKNIIMKLKKKQSLYKRILCM